MKKAAVSSILIAAILLAVAVIAEAQQPKKVHLPECPASAVRSGGESCPRSRQLLYGHVETFLVNAHKQI
jgi:transposase-like protein